MASRKKRQSLQPEALAPPIALDGGGARLAGC
jgi:hypothetical protein